MHRRTFLTGLAASIAAACSQFSSLRGTSRQKKHRGGKLYFYDQTDYLHGSELTKIVNRTIHNFAEVGITFARTEILTKGNFPLLQGLDILMYMVDGEAQGAFPIDEQAYIAASGAEEQRTLYEALKEKTGFPYTPEISAANTGFVSPDSIPELITPLVSNITRADILECVTQLTTHELAHGLAAGHVVPASGELTYGYFLGDQHPRMKYRFHPGNVQIMKHFIEAVNEGNLTAKEIITLREKLRKRYEPL